MPLLLSRFTALRHVSCTHYVFGWLLLFALSLASPLVLAEELDTDALSKQLDGIEKSLAKKQVGQKELKKFAIQATDIGSEGKSCVAEYEIKQQEAQAVLDTLGEPVKQEPADVRRKRNEVQKVLSNLSKHLASCRVLAIRSADLQKKIETRTSEVLAVELLARGPDVITLLRENWEKPTLWLTATKNFLLKNSGLDLLPVIHWIIFILVLFFTLGPALVARHYIFKHVREKSWHDDFASQFLRTIITTPTHYLPHLTASTAVAILFYFTTIQVSPLPFLSIVAFGLPFYFLFVAIVHLLFAPPQPATLFLDMPEGLARALARRFQVLAFLAYLGYLLFSTLLAQSLPESALLLARAIFATILILNLIWAFSIIMRLPQFKGRHWLTALVHVLLTASLIIELLGYRNLAWELARDVLGSLLALGLLVLLSRLFRELYENLDKGEGKWSKIIRKVLGTPEKVSIPGLTWVRLITTLSLWTLFAFLLLLVWDVSETMLLDIEAYLKDGFNLGTFHIVPVKLAIGFLMVAVIILVGGWFRNQLQTSWLKKTRMERGAKEALISITGYVIFAIALLVGAGIAGFNFQNLAIIAGALSVGIGFGLQNIVNNFVSGLILLFERPVKTGDWIVVGTTEGYVKSIRIRSTQIQTFDRADVIVPNSELISGQVTNWMFRDTKGRARIPVGVAYGSDVQKVKAILEDLAEGHPRVVIDGSVSKPKVLFLGFGDSSLNFELRCFIDNIDMRLSIISDINFAIDDAFREEGIEIPFPQRDIHIRSGQTKKEDDNQSLDQDPDQE